MAGSKMPPGARQGVTAAGGYLNGHTLGPAGKAVIRKSLQGHDQHDISSVAPPRTGVAPKRNGQYLFGSFAD